MAVLTGEIGHAMINGLRVPIAEVSLKGGRVIFLCRKAGPVPAFPAGVPRAVTVFGEDGTGVCQGYTGASWREVKKGEVLDFTVTLRMDLCYGDAEATDGQGS